MDAVTLAAANAAAKKRYPQDSRGMYLPAHWDDGWATAKAAGSPNIAVVGDSITAGIAAGTPTPDSILHGYVGRLEALLAAKLGLRAEFYPIYSYGPISGASTSVSPFGNWSTGTASEFPSGVGIVQGPTVTGVWSLTVTLNASPVVAGTTPTGMDLLVVDFVASQTWQYRVDGGAPITVTTSAAATGGNSTAVLRRIPISMTAGTHTVDIGQTSAANTLQVLGVAIYYGATGVGVARQGIASWRAIDYAGGAGNGKGPNSLNAQMPDRIKPWSGIQDANNTSGSTFPWAPDLGIIALGLNDMGFGSHLAAYESALTRFIHAFRAGKPKASIIMLATAAGNTYSDNAPSGWQQYTRYKRVMHSLAEVYHCAYLDFDTIWEPNPIASGYILAGNPHPTGNGKGAGGGDGHLAMATTIASIL